MEFDTEDQVLFCYVLCSALCCVLSFLNCCVLCFVFLTLSVIQIVLYIPGSIEIVISA